MILDTITNITISADNTTDQEKSQEAFGKVLFFELIPLGGL